MPNYYELSGDEDDDSQSQLSRTAGSPRGESSRSRITARGADTTNDTSFSRDQARDRDTSRRKSRNRSSGQVAAEDDDSWMEDLSSEQRRENRRRRLGLSDNNGSGSRRSNGMNLDQPSSSRSDFSENTRDRSRGHSQHVLGFESGPRIIPELNFNDDNLNLGPEEESDISKLARAWGNERASPEILDWKDEIIDNVVEEVNQQVVSRNEDCRRRQWRGYKPLATISS